MADKYIQNIPTGDDVEPKATDKDNEDNEDNEDMVEVKDKI